MTLPLTFAALSGAQAQKTGAGPFIGVLTGNVGGVYYQIGSALASAFGDRIPGSKPSAQATKGSADNLGLLQAGKGEIGFTQGDTLDLAWAGDADAGFKTKLNKLRMVARIYPNFIQIVTLRDSGITTLTDLKGKRVAVGAVRSGLVLNMKALLKAAGMGFEDLGRAENLTFEASMDLMKNRELDAACLAGGLGFPALNDIAGSFAVRLVEVPAAIVIKAGSPYRPAIIPKGSYKGQDQDVPTAGLPNYLVTRADLAPELVYGMTRALFESTAALVASHPAAVDIQLAQAIEGISIPLHAGAEKYYKEHGLIR